MNNEETAERVTSQNAIRLHAILLLDLRNQFRRDEFEEIIGAAGGGELTCVRSGSLRWSQIASAIGVGDPHHDHFGHAAIPGKEFYGAAGMADVRVTVRHVHHRISALVGFISWRCADK